MEGKRATVAEFSAALRAFADHLDSDPGRAGHDVGHELFVACTGLTGVPGFDRYLRRQADGMCGYSPCNPGRWFFAFLGLCGAVAKVAYDLAREEGAAGVSVRVAHGPTLSQAV
jgi:hypothetical protein